MGQQGYLATIANIHENEFITEHFLINNPDPLSYCTFLGGYQLPDSPTPSANWLWVTGEPFDFTNWYPGEPNYPIYTMGVEDNEENYLSIWDDKSDHEGGKWNDLDDGHDAGYIIQYAPEPTSVMLLAFGGLTILSRRRRRAESK